jgi:dCTP deaminase
MIEPYQWLLKNCKELGFKESNIGPASVDLCLDQVKVWSVVRESFIRKQVDEDTNQYYLNLGKFFLCNTEEYIKVPNSHCAEIFMRSSWARKSLGHKMAGFIDPGFEGQITLELETNTGVYIPKGERIVQIVYHRLTEESKVSYTGKYLKQKGPTEAYKS